jgi:hypothetical protein
MYGCEISLQKSKSTEVMMLKQRLHLFLLDHMQGIGGQMGDASQLSNSSSVSDFHA